MSAYLNLLTVYPDQPYDQPEIIHPISGCTIVKPEDMADFQTVLPKEEKVLEIVRAKIAAGEEGNDLHQLDTDRYPAKAAGTAA